MSRQPFTVENYNGVDTNTPAYSTPYGNNKFPPIDENGLPINYPKRNSNNKPLEAIYSNTYDNDYKIHFDSRYPSIWRRPTAINYVRRLDDWETAALSAALGVPWTPTGTGGPGGPTPPAPEPAPRPAPRPAPAVTTEREFYGPYEITFGTQAGGAGADGDTAPEFDTNGTRFQLYIVKKSDNTKEYFVRGGFGNLYRLTKDRDNKLILNYNNNLFISNELADSFIIDSDSEPLGDSDTISNITNILNNINDDYVEDPDQSSIVYTTGYRLVENLYRPDEGEILPIYYNNSVLFISDTEQTEYQIGAHARDTYKAYFMKDDMAQTYFIQNAAGEADTYTNLLALVSNPGSLATLPNAEQFSELVINPLTEPTADPDTQARTGGKYKKNKNKSRRFKKHFRKTRKSRKE